jgi:hypothetical protein
LLLVTLLYPSRAANVPFNAFRGFLPLIDRLPRWVLRVLGRALPIPTLHTLMNIVDIMHNTTIEIYAQKKSALEKGNEAEQPGAGKDIMSVLSAYPLFFTIHVRSLHSIFCSALQ